MSPSKASRLSHAPLISTGSGERVGGKHKTTEAYNDSPKVKKITSADKPGLPASRGYVFSGAAPSGASGSGVGTRVGRELQASSISPTLDHHGRGQILHPPSARAPPPRPRPLRGAPQGEVCPARTLRQVHDLTHYGGPVQDPAAATTKPKPLDIQPFPDQQVPPPAPTASRDDCRLPPRAPPLRCQDAPAPGADGWIPEPVETRNRSGSADRQTLEPIGTRSGRGRG